MVDFEYKKCYDIKDFQNIIALLRSENGCPWDREQSHKSIRRNLLEEAYEVCEAIDEENTEHLREELGDLLMQIIFHSQIEHEKGSFDLDAVADRACKKLILRHPHVFGAVEVRDSNEVLENWDAIKRKEKSQHTTAEAMESVAKTLPALWRAEKVQSKAAKTGFDWNSTADAIAKLREELCELEEAVLSADAKNINDELGDVLFATIKVARFTNVDPEDALNHTCDKFISRFKGVENAAIYAGRSLEDHTLDEMIELYSFTKNQEKLV